MPQGSSAWVWMSIATTSSILGSFNFGMVDNPDDRFVAGRFGMRINKNDAALKASAEANLAGASRSHG
jgi:hypothetical protein